MLDLAIKHKEALQSAYINICFEERYKFAMCNSYREELNIVHDTWNKYQFVSLDASGGIVGYISYSITRETLNVSDLLIINFKENDFSSSKIFGEDLREVVWDLFYKFNFNKLSFSVAIGNPIEKFYDRKIKQIGGKIVGIAENDVKLLDNKYYDVKKYEVLKENFLKNTVRSPPGSIEKIAHGGNGVRGQRFWRARLKKGYTKIRVKKSY